MKQPPTEFPHNTGRLDMDGCEVVYNSLQEWKLHETHWLKDFMEEFVELTLKDVESKKCVGCELHFPLYWHRGDVSGVTFWYHEDGAGGIICERHPDNEAYWRTHGKEVSRLRETGTGVDSD